MGDQILAADALGAQDSTDGDAASGARHAMLMVHTDVRPPRCPAGRFDL
jgi:hypothetical protein